jgi:Na+-driven multidrug efflux pump
MVARAFGRKDMDEVSRIAMSGQVLSGILGLLTAIVFVAFSQPILQLVGADPKLAENAKDYKMTCFFVRFQTGRWYRSALKEAKRKAGEP